MGKLGLALLVFSIFSFTSQLSVGAETKPSPVWVKDFDVEISDIAISADGKFIAVGPKLQNYALKPGLNDLIPNRYKFLEF
jgi:hypothetical protein